MIGNGHYPDANAPLTQSINDARALTSALRRDGFDVDVVEDASKDDMARAVERLKAKIRPDSVVMLFFGGYGVQAGRESYMIPVDATIWKEADVRRDGISIESVLGAMKERGAPAKLVVVDASRRNPYERRFRAFSHGLAPINAPENALILSSTTPGKVVDDSSGQNSLLVAELLNNLNAQAGIETVFSKTRVAISRASEGEQVPSVSSSLVEDVRIAGGVVGPAAPEPIAAADVGVTRCICDVMRRCRASSISRPRRRSPGRTGSPSRSSAPARATTMSPSAMPSRISTWPPDINPTSTRRVSTRVAPHHLNHGAGRPVEDRGQRHRDAAAFAGLDQGAAGGVDQQALGRLRPTTTTWPSWLLGSTVVDTRRTLPVISPAPTIRILAVWSTASFDDVPGRHLADQVELAARDDAEQRLALAGRDGPGDRGRGADQAGDRRRTWVAPPSGRLSRARTWPAVTVSPASTSTSATLRPGRSGRTAISSFGIRIPNTSTMAEKQDFAALSTVTAAPFGASGSSAARHWLRRRAHQARRSAPARSSRRLAADVAVKSSCAISISGFTNHQTGMRLCTFGSSMHATSIE